MIKSKIVIGALILGCISGAFADGVTDMIAAQSLFGNGNTTMQQGTMPTDTTNANVIVPPISAASGAALGSGAVGNSGSATITNTAPNMSANSTVTNNTQAVRRAPVPPNAFQNSVMVRTGLALQQYGYNLFTVPNTYTPVTNVPIDNNYTLGPGDQIYLQAWGAVSISYTADVAPDGTIYIPNVGTFNVAGVKAGSLEGYLKKQIGRVYKKFQLSATVSKIRSIQVNVAGYAEAPGTYTVSSLTTLVNAVFAAGGPAANGSLRHIELRRNGVTVNDFDMYQVLLKGSNTADVRLLPGDIIYFAPKGNEVAIYDGVKFPAIYEARNGETVSDILNYAGGTSFDNNKSKVVIEEISNNSKIAVFDYAYQQGLIQQVHNGDIIHFMRMNHKYDQTIVLMGNVANPTRLQYRSGMRVRDVIPNKEALLTTSFWNSYSYNTYGRDYQLTNRGGEKTTNRGAEIAPVFNYSNGLGDTSAAVNTNNQTPANQLFNSPTGNNRNATDFTVSDNLLQAGPIAIPEADINWDYAAIIRIDPSDYKTHLIPFNLAKAIAGDPANNIALQPGDIIDILSTKDVRTSINNNPIFVFIDGEVKSPGVYEVNSSESIVDVINRAGGLTNKAYLFGMELDRKSVQQKQSMLLNEMLDQAQQTLLAQASVAGGNAISAAQGQIQGQVLQQQSAFIDKLRQIKPVGRVVLGFNDAKVSLKDIPNLPMENGDTIYVPPSSHTVEVIGQVYNPASFVYYPHLSVNDYIGWAGSENDYADTSNEYILRADGRLYSKQRAGWFGAFGSRTLDPGDAIIVPQQVQIGSTLQNVLNWTQILANFGTAAAAIQVFKK